MTKDLAKLDKPTLVKMATNMRSRADRYKKNAEGTMERFLHGAVGGGAALVTGMYMGGLEKDYQALVAAEGQEAADEKDPRTIGGVPKDAIAGLVLWGLGLADVGGKKVAPLLEAAGAGALHGFLYNFGSERALAAPDEQAV